MIFSNIASVQFFFLVINLILYSVPPTRLLQVQFNAFFELSHLFTLSPQLIKISSYEPVGKFFEFKYNVNKFDVFVKLGLNGSLTTSRS